ncbi:Lcl C-terminal domain-containing protein [Sulfurimonas sp.]
MKYILLSILCISSLFAIINIPDTAQKECYDNSSKIECSKAGAFSAQDAYYETNNPSYTDNRDGTVSDNVTGLMWSKEVEDSKVSLEEATLKARRMNLAGYGDWRVPTVKELYSLIDFRGYTGFSRIRGNMNDAPSNAIPYINTDYFDFKYGAKNERYIDAQWLSRTEYVSTTMDNMKTLFGVNFADGRIKGYGYKRVGSMQSRKKFYVRYVRGTTQYGKNRFKDNRDETLTDKSTNLMWTKVDSKKGMSWKDALEYASNLEHGGHSDWRLPNIKELQYIVDYTRSPDTTSSPAISPLFNLSSITNENGQRDYPYYWSSTTHQDGPNRYTNASYISFGRAIGKMRGSIMDVHGAGAQRSDPKVGSQNFHGPQGDALRSNNYVICVRGGNVEQNQSEVDYSKYPYRLNIQENSSESSSSSMQRPDESSNQRPEHRFRPPPRPRFR